jgi:hypothetical protein
MYAIASTRRDFIRLSALAASALAMPARAGLTADANPSC